MGVGMSVGVLELQMTSQMLASKQLCIGLKMKGFYIQRDLLDSWIDRNSTARHRCMRDSILIQGGD